MIGRHAGAAPGIKHHRRAELRAASAGGDIRPYLMMKYHIKRARSLAGKIISMRGREAIIIIDDDFR